ncbi:TIGR04211 family SH3 domain-containing protein [Candidatus Williamhamiltonella defendens]|uniref:TIGR04211 family SH3 domain-containing protein n=1 Tax=Candidatus Williamhamiltonella defendens TaxID=138072 RepID=UPI00130E59F8|nr:TIGR04211 family SH3 domain-containing protein [Candidatus Hamiltonella defensa]
MKKRHCIYLVILSLSLSLSAQAAEEERYISDNLTTYVYSGPGDEYRILGVLKVDEPVTLLDAQTTNQYAQIRDKKGRVFWIPAKHLSTVPSQLSRLPNLEQIIKNLTDQLNDTHHRLKERSQEIQAKIAFSEKLIEGLKNENTGLKEQLTIRNQQINEVQNKTNADKNNIMMKWFTYGGMVAGTSFIFGLLLPFLIPRRKKNHRWID